MTRRAAAASLAAIFLLGGCSRLGETSRKGDSTSPARGRTVAPPMEGADSAPELELDYAVLLEDNGGAKRINEKYHFRGGERFRIELRPAFTAHVYIVNRGPRQTSCSFLFPSTKIATENPLQANAVVTLPGMDRWYTLDDRPGIENVALIASATPIVEFNTPEMSIPRDECEDRLSLVERDYRPSSSSRFEDKVWTKLFVATGDKTAIVLRLPLDHR